MEYLWSNIKSHLVGILLSLIALAGVFALTAEVTKAQRPNRGLALPPGYNDTVEQARGRRALKNLMLGSMALEEGRIREARLYFERALRYDEGSVEIRKKLVETLVRLRQYDKARAEALKIDPLDAESARLLADLYHRAQMADSVMHFLGIAIELDSSDVETRRRMVAFLENYGFYDSAMVYREQIADLTNDFRAWAALGAAWFQQRNFKKAEKAFKRSIEINSTKENIASLTGLADTQASLGKTDEQRETLGKLLALDETNIPTHRRFIEYYSRLGQFDSALIHSKREVELSPQDIRAIRRLGVISYNADSLELAKEQFDLLVSLGDASVLNYYYLGLIFLDEENYRYSLLNFRKAANLADTLADGWLGVAQVYETMDSTEQVEITFDKALKHVLNPDERIRLLFAQGAFYERQKNLDAVTKAFEEILAIDSNHAPALNYLGYSLIEAGRRVSYGKKLVTRALEISPDNGAYIDSYAWALYQEGRYREALDSLRRAVQLIPSDPTIFEHVGDVFEKLNQPDSARFYWRRALEKDSTNATLLNKLQN